MTAKITKQKGDKAKLVQLIELDREEMVRVRQDCENDLLSAKKQKEQAKQELDQVCAQVN